MTWPSRGYIECATGHWIITTKVDAAGTRISRSGPFPPCRAQSHIYPHSTSGRVSQSSFSLAGNLGPAAPVLTAQLGEKIQDHPGDNII